MKKLLAVLLSVLMIASSTVAVFSLSVGEEITSGVPQLSIINPATSSWLNQAKKIVANDKYIFVARGRLTTWRLAGAVDIFDRATGEYIKRITQASDSTNSNYSCSVRDIWVDGNTLYITWGNAVTSTSTGQASRAKTNEKSPLKYYDVTNVTADTTLTGVTIEATNAYAQAHAPYTLGASSYLDAENGKIYQSSVMNKTYNRREYYIMETANPTSKKIFTTQNMDAAKFVVKDGWLFEILQDKAGFTSYTGASTMTGNNEIHIYDLNSVLDTLTGTYPSIAEQLKAKYVTTTAGGVAINDIEVVGNTMYVATNAGIEVVDISSVKEEGITKDTAKVLTASKTITEEGKGGVMELKMVGDNLWAGYTGPEVYAAMEETIDDVVVKSGDGALVLYNAEGEKVASKTVPYGVADFLVLDDAVYVVHDVGSNTKGTTPKMSAYSLDFSIPEFNTEFSLGEEIAENLPVLENERVGSSTLNSASKIVENDKYIFVAMGAGTMKTLGGAVLVYDKETGEYINSITQESKANNYYNPVKDLEISGDTLYITWANAVTNLDTGVASRTIDDEGAPLKSYDVSTVTAETEFVGTTLSKGNAYAQNHAPYTWGGSTYLDEESGKIYTNYVMNATYGRKQYRVIDIKTGIVANAFYTPNQNTVKFIVKDGWLFEILQDKAGLTNYTGESTMTGNNEIRIFNLNGAWEKLTGVDKSAASYLKGVYTTSVSGGAAIKDVEVIGDTMYVATTEGIDVVDITPAKQDGITSSTAATLTASKTVKETYGAVLDIEVVSDKLYAGFAGAEIWEEMTSSTGGALVVYDENMVKIAEQEVAYGVADITVCEKEQRIYIVNDTKETGSVSAIDYRTSSLILDADGVLTSTLSAGTYDVKVNLKNEDLFDGVLICALYEGNALSDVIIKNNPGNGTVTVAEDYEIGENITKVKTMFFADLELTQTPLCDYCTVLK